MIALHDSSAADLILDFDEDQCVHSFVGDLAQRRELTRLVRNLNRAILSGTKVERNKALNALARMGFVPD